jgi:SAM-dependent methyltransferase
MIDFTPFVENDPRKYRPTVTVTVESLTNRCEVMLPSDLIKGKSILDVGCALGAMGYWSLENGVYQYDGVEIQDGYKDKARELLASYDNANIYKFLGYTSESYDIVVAAGVIHGTIDLISLLHQICSKAREYVILETHLIAGVEPSIALTMGNMIKFEDVNNPFSGVQLMPNRPAIDLLMKCNGFDLDVDLFPKPILGSHDAYNTKTGADRFIARYKRSGKMTTLEEAIYVGV